MTVFSRLEDPKVLTLIMAALVSAILWLATWSTMSGMGAMDMSMDMSSSGSMGAEMSSDATSGTMSPDADAPAPMAMGDGAPMSGAEMSGDRMAMTMDMPGMSMDPTDWSARTILVTTAMWVLMMAAMMLPAMAPVMSVYAAVSAKEDQGLRLALRITLFTLSYLSIWAVFSGVAALGQLALRASPYFSMGGTLAAPVAGGVLLIIAGVWQFTPVKDVCLRHCRHPLQYLLSHWRPGLAGAFPVGLRHGLYCFGCCVALMGLMFVLGAMTVWWMAVIAAYFLAEKVLPGAEIWGKFAGGLMVAAGAALVVVNV
ncbi:MAG: DUF2182 domain-containing protein [Pseudomonadota bacterium]